MAMLPKGDEPLGNCERTLMPSTLRHLSMKNTDVKLIASAANTTLSHLAKDTSEEQKGFVRGRQFLRNVVQ
eukprot:6490539-Pyramimonas_sp.AAC.1